MYEYIPEELKKLKQWVCWKGIPDPLRGGKIKKIPVNALTGGQAQSNNAETWTDFNTAVSQSQNYTGIGFMFNDNGYFGVDLDGIDKEMQDFKNGGSGGIAGEFIHSLQTYTEISQSGKGVHMICKGTLPKGGRRKGNVEMYQSGRFFVMTGNICAEYAEINDCTQVIKQLHEKYIGGGREPAQCCNLSSMDANLDISEIVELAKKSKQGSMFSDLFDGKWDNYFTSQSEADMSFCNMLAFWTGRDANKMDAIFRQSGLMRDKWTRRQTGSTYGAITIKKAIDHCDNVYTPPTPGTSFSVNISSPTASKNKTYSFDDMGNAQRIIDMFGNKIRYCYTDKSWLYFDERKWACDNTGAICRIADVVINNMKNEMEIYKARDEEDGGDMAKQFHKHIKISRSNRGKNSAIKETEHLVPILPSQLDKNKWIINTPNGIVNLKNGKLEQHRIDAYITKITNTEYIETSECPKWIEFLNQTFKGDQELIRYVQKSIGYSLTGSTAEQCAFFLYGTGRNGKSTFIDTVKEIFGDYATNIQPDTIMTRNNNNGASSDIARLKGARFVSTVEPGEGMRVNEGLLKQLTGEDTVTARRLYGNEFEFKPEFKLFMATNHKPIIRGTDTGIWRRIHLIPFECEITEEQADRQLSNKLRAELPAIFKWAVDGCLMYQQEGLKKPQVVMNAIAEYRGEMDVISNFIDACCTQGGEIQASKLYKVYADWANTYNEYKMSSTKFGTEMAKKYKRVKKSTVFFQGISVVSASGFSL